MTIRWITPLLGTASADGVRGAADLRIIDVRDLVDKAGNRADTVKERILLGVRCLEKGMRTVVCCDYGISRSNAVAAGILAIHEKTSLDVAVRKVLMATGGTEIKLAPLESVRSAIGAETRSKSGGKRAILVTGAGGFIGSALCKQMHGEGPVIGFSRAQLNVEEGSTLLSLLVAEHNIGCIVHLANPKVFSSNLALGKTLTMLRNVLEVCASRDIQLVYPSGWEIYSGYSAPLSADESIPALPLGPYGETKYLSELLINHWQRTAKVRCAILRSSPVYGAGGTKPKFMFSFIERARAGEPIITHRYLNGDPTLDLLHIDDFVDAVVKVCRQEYVGDLNIGTGISTTTREVAEMVKAELKSASQIDHAHIESNTASVAMNFQKARHVLGWEPRIKLQDGLRQILAASRE